VIVGVGEPLPSGDSPCLQNPIPSEYAEACRVQQEQDQAALQASIRRGNVRMALFLGVPFLLLGTGLFMILGKRCT
jgi:hypothetical protein